MRHSIRSTVVVGATALLLGSGAGTATAQGSLEFPLPFGLDIAALDVAALGIPGLASLAPDTAVDPTTPPPQEGAAADLMPAEVRAMAFEGSVVAAVNDARLVVGADRLVTDPALEASARERAAQLAEGDTTTGEVTVPEDAATGEGDDDNTTTAADSPTDPAISGDRTVLTLPEGATPQKALSTLLADTGMRERMLDGKFTHIGVGVATADDGTVYVVQDFARD